MSTRNHYDEDFKRTLVELYHNGKTQASLIKEYGVSQSALTKWIKQYSTVETDSGEVLTAKQVKELQKRMAQLEEENQILKKRLPYSRHTQTKIRRRLQAPERAFDQDPVPGLAGQSEYVLQAFFQPSRPSSP